MAWGVFLDNAWRVKAAGLGTVIGVDTEAARRRLTAAGVDDEVAEDLLTACEIGAVTAWNEKDEADGGQN